MTSAQSLRQLNKELAGRPDWWWDTRRVHPARQIVVPLVRSSEAEVAAKAFFAEVAKDAELLVKRASILFQWHRRSA